MKTSKRILSSILAILMVFSVWSVGFTAVAVDTPSGSILDEIVLEPAARPEVDFYCTNITRVAAGVDSTLPGTTIVKATPSGVPELSGPYASQAYAGETPAATRVTFTTPTTGISILGFSCSNETVTFTDMAYVAPGTYYVDIAGGTATAGEALTFTIDYTWIDGNTYQEKCVSYVEGIATGGSYAELQTIFRPWSGTNSFFYNYASASTRLLGDGVYYETPANAETSSEDPYRTYGVYNVATGALTENVAAGYNTSIYVNDQNPSVTGASKDISINEFIPGTTTAHVYVDASEAKTLADINLRIDSNVGTLSDRNNSNPHTALADAFVYSGSITTQPASYVNDATAQAAIGLDIPAKADYGVKRASENTSMTTLTSGVGQYQKLFTVGLNGNVANLLDGSSYTVLFRYYSYYYAKEGALKRSNMTNDIYLPLSMTFHVVDKSALREMIDFVMNSDPDSPRVANNKKGVNPQAWYYRTGFAQFQSAYIAALTALNNPKITQEDIDAAAKSLQSSYSSLTLKTADYTEVNDLYDQADEILENESAYPPSDIALIREAQEGVVNSYNILYQGAVDTMAENLRTAIENATPYTADYSDVYAAIDEFEALEKAGKESYYTHASWYAVESAINAVEYNIPATRQTEVDAMAKAITDALEKLEAVKADKSRLQKAVNDAEAIDRSLYINGPLLIAPLETAKEALLTDWTISQQAEVDRIAKALEDAIAGLIPRSADKSALETALNLELTKSEENYDQDLLAEYKALVAEGEEMYNDSSLTILDNDKIAAKAKEITDAYNAVEASYKLNIDTSALEEALDDAEAVNKDIYEDDDAMAELEAAVAEGEEILANLAEGDEQKVADAAARIEAAIENLNKKPADLSAIAPLSEKLEALKAETIDVTTYVDGELGSEAKAKYDVSAIEAIEAKIADFDTTGLDIEDQATIDAFVEEIEAEIEALEVLAYSEYLDVAIEEYEGIDSSLYTETSWDAYEAAYDAAVALEDAAQADINTALENLVNAKGDLTVAASFDKAEDTTTVVDKEAGIIYGLTDEGISDLEEFVEYTGGVVEYEESANGFGTGTVVNFVVNGKVSESYVIIIFGDITGDGVVDTFDYSTLAAIINGDIEVEEGSALYKAADVFADGAVDTFDLAVLSAYIIGNTEISQTPDLF